MINKLDNLEDKIKNNGLHHLQNNKPIIINLDDLEVFRAMSSKHTKEKDFIDLIESWEKTEIEKGPFHYNFSFFIATKFNMNRQEK